MKGIRMERERERERERGNREKKQIMNPEREREREGSTFEAARISFPIINWSLGLGFLEWEHFGAFFLTFVLQQFSRILSLKIRLLTTAPCCLIQLVRRGRSPGFLNELHTAEHKSHEAALALEAL
jgi:hypothetical protein